MIGYPGRVVVVCGAQWGDEGKGKIVDILAPQYQLCCRYRFLLTIKNMQNIDQIIHQQHFYFERYNGGSNAGHTLWFRDEKGDKIRVALHLLPSGLFAEKSSLVVGNGTVLHLPTLMKELKLAEQHNVKLEGMENVPYFLFFYLRAKIRNLVIHSFTIILSLLGRLFLSDRAHIVLNLHQMIDGLQEGERASAKIGTTGYTKHRSTTYSQTRTSYINIYIYICHNFENTFSKIINNTQKRNWSNL